MEAAGALIDPQMGVSALHIAQASGEIHTTPLGILP
jgi:type III secretory pathway component EscT